MILMDSVPTVLAFIAVYASYFQRNDTLMSLKNGVPPE